MNNPESLPFRSPDSDEVDKLARAFKSIRANSGDLSYSDEDAKKDAALFLSMRNAKADGFIDETGVVKGEGITFYIGSERDPDA